MSADYMPLGDRLVLDDSMACLAMFLSQPASQSIGAIDACPAVRGAVGLGRGQKSTIRLRFAIEIRIGAAADIVAFVGGRFSA
jgi:hypothetical protein